MIDLTGRRRIVITCPKRITPFLVKDLEETGYTPEYTWQTGAEVMGNFRDCIRLNLRLRCASQVLLSLRTFQARTPEEVYQFVRHLPWELLLSPDGYFSVTSVADHESIRNSMFLNVKVKDGIVDRMREVFGRRPDSGSELRGVVVHIFWKGEEAELFLDTTGETLARHGYRINPWKAPMQESLAAAALLATQWDRRTPLINPMCGSGTLAIEAALQATGRRPGLLREKYAFMQVLGYDRKWYQEELRQIRQEVVPPPEGLKILASDISEEACEITRKNAREAGVGDLIKVVICDILEMVVPEGPGVVILNPEYGERLGEDKDLEILYARIGQFLKQKCGGYLGYVFTANLELATKIGLKARRRIEFYNAKLDCRLLEYELYAGSRRNVD